MSDGIAELTHTRPLNARAPCRPRGAISLEIEVGNTNLLLRACHKALSLSAVREPGARTLFDHVPIRGPGDQR
jgi:hypothetical protein